MASSSVTTEIAGRRGSLNADQPNLRLVLVGITGAGKSSSGNTILGRRAFRVLRSASSVTKECSKETESVCGREITVVDTPGMLDTHISEEELLKEKICKCLNMTAPGPHAIILVIKVDVFTEEVRRSVKKIRAIFGEDADKHTIVLFTHGDKLSGSIEEFMEDNEALQEVLSRCGGRHHVFNNKHPEDRSQVVEFLQKVDAMVAANGGEHYTSDSYQEVESKLKTKEEELMKVYEKKEMELESRFAEEMKKLEERIEKLTASEQEKEEKIKELERLNQSKMKEYKRYYKMKCKEARDEAEHTYTHPNIMKRIYQKILSLFTPVKHT